ncbi:MAG: hypothetical protein Q8S73_42995 [Deltaproteobacteria bacterium]|nr:hypothetical protein [Myxococcales bacterium]MDP3220930.1 hypothetical protein [Deltaproteobacteria bacterium]
MTTPAYQEFVTLGDFLRLGLPPEALRTARTTHAPITPTGAGAGLVVPAGCLDVAALELDQLAVRVQVVVGGVPGVATWRWSPDGGTTWTTAATTPATAAAPLVMPWGVPTGVSVRFVGTLVTGATYAWTSVSAVATCRRAGNEEIARYLARAFTLPLTEVPTDVVRDGCCIIAADVMAVTGYRPADGADELIEKRAAGARKRFAEAQRGETQPRATEAAPAVRGPRVSTGTRR